MVVFWSQTLLLSESRARRCDGDETSPSRVYEDHLPGGADPKREAVMANVLLPIHPTERVAAAPVARPFDAKEQARLERMIETKVAQGYRIESQDDQQALLVRDPRRRLGIGRSGRETRELVSINQWGYPRIEQQ